MNNQRRNKKESTGQKKHFIPYNKVPADKILRIAEYIKTVEIEELKKFVLNEFSKYFGSDVKNPLPSCSIEIKPLLNIADALVVVTFNSYPYTNPEPPYIGGFTRVIKQDIKGSQPIPVAYMSNSQTTLLKHESIHACQYLHDISYPMTSKQKDIYLSDNLLNGAKYFLETAGEEEMVDFGINAICYKTWIEIEANYYTIGSLNCWRWMNIAYLSSWPIESFDGLSESVPWKKEHSEKVEKRFSSYCNLMEQEVKWVKDAVRSLKWPCLFDLIWEIHDQYESNMMFGDIDKYASYDIKKFDLDNDEFQWD